MTLREIGEKAKAASREVAAINTEKKNQVLETCAQALIANSGSIIKANQEDLKVGQEKGMPQHLQDRLMLNQDRIEAMAEGIREMVALPDPVGEILTSTERPNGLRIETRRVPMGVIGIIYEARPNVTADAFGLCFKAGNAVILKGGSDAINSNKEIVRVMCDAIESCRVTRDALLLIEDTSRETAQEFMRLNEFVDVLIPRGGAGLIKTVVESSTIPVIETGTGNCHVYVSDNADQDMALKIVINAKTQRNSVCNACESLLVNENIAQEFLPKVVKELANHGVEMRCDKEALELAKAALGDSEEPLIKEGTEEDWAAEFLDSIISVNIVKDTEEAIGHINKYNTGHSETIVTGDEGEAEEFLNRVDAACVYANASTRFTDGFEFGFGGEIGISTQKLHARGPMGLKELTSYKYIIHGDGQIRG